MVVMKIHILLQAISRPQAYRKHLRYDVKGSMIGTCELLGIEVETDRDVYYG